MSGPPPIRRETMCRMYREGMEVTEIACHFGVTNKAVLNALRLGGALPPYLSGFNIKEHKRERHLEAFAEHLASGLPVSAAAAQIGMGRDWGKDALRAIRRQLGAQAI